MDTHTEETFFTNAVMIMGTAMDMDMDISTIITTITITTMTMITIMIINQSTESIKWLLAKMD